MTAGVMAGALISVFCGASAAADLTNKRPAPVYTKAPVVVPYNWTGWYIGANAGYGWGGDGKLDPRATGFDTGLFPGQGTAFVVSELAGLSPLNTNPKGFIGGIQTGYNYQINSFIVGIEADYSWGNIVGSQTRGSNTALSIVGSPGFGVTTNIMGQEKLNSFGTLRGRLGVTPFDRVLIFGTGGFAYGAASSNISVAQIETGPTPCVTFTPSSGSASRTLTGWTVGGGGEWAFASNWSLKAEYLYYRLGALKYPADQINSISCPTSVPASTPFVFVNPAPLAEFNGSIVRFGLNYKFDWP